MKKIRIIGTRSKDGHFDDVARIIVVLAAAGYECSSDQAITMWSKYSDSADAMWAELPKNNTELVRCVIKYFVEVPDSGMPL